MTQLNFSSNPFNTSTGSGAEPLEHLVREVMSYLSTICGVFKNMANMAGTPAKPVTLYFSISLQASSRSNQDMRTLVFGNIMPTFITVSPNEWERGSINKPTSCGSGVLSCEQLTAFV